VRLTVVNVATGAAAEVHYWDKMSVRHGSTTDWVAGGTAATGNERMVTVFGQDESGAAISGALKTQLDTYLESLRETNFVVNVADPTFGVIDGDTTVKVVDGFDATTVHDAVVAALQDYFDSVKWGAPADGDPRDWNNTTVVRYLEVAQVINSVDGVDYITTTGGNYDLRIAINPTALARADITLPGAAPVATYGTWTITTT
jgi:hypothetical protein